MSARLLADWNTLLRLARAEVERTRNELPEPLLAPAASLPVVYETAPSAELVEDGIEADTLGLFTGDPLHAEGQSVLSPHITLFLENLWDFADQDPQIFQDEVRITYVHELGHYLGLDEDDLDERGLL